MAVRLPPAQPKVELVWGPTVVEVLLLAGSVQPQESSLTEPMNS
jgi:hypothetical protein